MASSEPWLLFYGLDLFKPQKSNDSVFKLFAQKNTYIPKGCIARLDLKCVLVNSECKRVMIDFPSLENSWARYWMKQSIVVEDSEVRFDAVLIDNTHWDARPLIIREGDPIVIISFL